MVAGPGRTTRDEIPGSLATGAGISALNPGQDQEKTEGVPFNAFLRVPGITAGYPGDYFLHALVLIQKKCRKTFFND
jgi:hypothetical protein